MPKTVRLSLAWRATRTSGKPSPGSPSNSAKWPSSFRLILPPDHARKVTRDPAWLRRPAAARPRSRSTIFAGNSRAARNFKSRQSGLMCRSPNAASRTGRALMEHPVQFDELPHTDTPPAVQAEPPVTLQGAADAAPLPPLPDVDPGDVLLLTPSDAQYRDYLPAANTRTQLGPALRAVCQTEQGVAAMVGWVRDNQLAFAVRCGGHSYEGFSQSSNVVIDLRGLADIDVDKAAGIVTAGSGAS